MWTPGTQRLGPLEPKVGSGETCGWVRWNPNGSAGLGKSIGCRSPELVKRYAGSSGTDWMRFSIEGPRHQSNSFITLCVVDHFTKLYVV